MAQESAPVVRVGPVTGSAKVTEDLSSVPDTAFVSKDPTLAFTGGSAVSFADLAQGFGSFNVSAIISASPGVVRHGTSATTDGADVCAATGIEAFIATSATTDGADVAASSGVEAFIGSSAKTDGADVTSTVGIQAFIGSSATTDGADVSGGGTDILAFIGSMSWADPSDGIFATGRQVLPSGAERRYCFRRGTQLMCFKTKQEMLVARRKAQEEDQRGAMMQWLADRGITTGEGIDYDE